MTENNTVAIQSSVSSAVQGGVARAESTMSSASRPVHGSSVDGGGGSDVAVGTVDSSIVGVTIETVVGITHSLP